MKKLLAGAAVLAATLLAAPAGMTSAQSETQVMLLHGIPDTAVDVAVDGSVVIEGFEFGDMQDLTAFAGQTLNNLEVLLAGTDTVAIGPVEAFDVPGSGNWTVVAHLDADGQPTITPFENDTSAVDAGQGRLTVRHTAAAPAVDIVLGDARPVVDLSNPNEQALPLPAGEVAGAEIAPTGGDPIADVPTVNVVADENLIVYAVGSLSDDTFTFLTQTVTIEAAAGDAAATGDGTPAPTEVNTGGELGATSGSSLTLFAAAAGLFALAGGAAVLRRRTVES